jgi:hypothetical protein
VLPAAVLLATLAVATPNVSPIPCYQTLKFGGVIYVDADQQASAAEVGPAAGVTDPNPAHCGLPDRLTVHRHAAHQTSAEVIYREPDGRNEIFRSAGAPGFPLQGLLRWFVLALVLVIVLFVAVPAILAHRGALASGE